MIVTRENFEMAFPIFEKALSKCDFVSYDLEMSGINNPGRENQNARYVLSRVVAKKMENYFKALTISTLSLAF